MPRFICFLLLMSLAIPQPVRADPPKGEDWLLVFEDEFDGGKEKLAANWQFQNGPSGHILCSRWGDNAKLEDGLLKLEARKEKRGGQDWTAASGWTKQAFTYGYFECRYRYAAATGTNNSFWIMTRGKPAQRFEIDINEGHFPNEVNMNLHNHTGKHWAKGGRWYYGPRPPDPTPGDAGLQFVLDKPVTTSRIRFVSTDAGPVRVMELRAFPPSQQGYPSVFPNHMEAQPDVPNLATGAKAEASSTLGRYTPEMAIDGKLDTNSRWLSARTVGPHHLSLDFRKPQAVGCLQFISGWEDNKVWTGIVDDFRLDYWDGTNWLPIPGASRKALQGEKPVAEPTHNLAKEFHIYALEWNEKELIYLFDGKVIRRMPNGICHGPAPVWLSLAIIKWAGAVTDAIDGASMDVDYVRVWQRKPQ